MGSRETRYTKLAAAGEANCSDLSAVNLSRRHFLGAGVGGALVAAGGAVSAAASGKAGSTATLRSAHQSGEDAVLLVGHHLDPTTLNPADTTTAAFQSVYAQIVEQLVIFDTETNEVTPWLAEHFEWVDELTLDLELKQGVMFTNGEPFNAESAKFTIDTFVQAQPYQFLLAPDVYNETEILDEYAVRVHLNREYSPFLGFLARGGAALPPRYYEEAGVEGYGQEPIGTGPFVLSEWVKDDHITLVRNPDYWRGPHPIAEVIYRVIPEDTARLAALETGEIDIALNVPASAVQRLEGIDNVEVVTAPGARKFATHFDTKSAESALDDARVRTALNHAVDKQAIVDSLFQGAADPLQGQWLVEQEFGFNPNVAEFEYDPDLARQLLADAGYADGFDLQFTYTVGRYPLDRELGEIVASYLEQVGVRVNQRALEYGAFIQIRGEESLGTHQWGLALPPDPHFNLSLFIEDTIYEFHNLGPEYSELVDQGTRETDPTEREAIYHRLAEIMHEDPPMLYLIVPRDNYALSTRVVGFEARQDQVLWLFDVSLSE